MKKFLFLCCFITILSCKESDDTSPPEAKDNFDRQAMLVNWADNIIVPGYTSFVEKTDALQSATTEFAANATTDNLLALRTTWLDAYVTWQRVSMFEIGKAEELDLANFLNIYPADVNTITSNIANNDYNLELPSTFDEQGFPALDYLLYGLAADDEAILEMYQNDEKHLQYLQTLSQRIHDLATTVLNDWTTTYRDAFVANDGNSANASVDKLVNDYIFNYEKCIRAGKIGIPAGVFSGAPLSDRVEAFYRKDISKILFLEALEATQQFFNGQDFNTLTNGESLQTYLDALQATKGSESLSTAINNQFSTVKKQAESLDNNFALQVETNNTQMLATYDQLQLNVVNLKVDMMQALNINVDFVDADGD